MLAKMLQLLEWLWPFVLELAQKFLAFCFKHLTDLLAN